MLAVECGGADGSPLAGDGGFQHADFHSYFRRLHAAYSAFDSLEDALPSEEATSGDIYFLISVRNMLSQTHK